MRAFKFSLEVLLKVKNAEQKKLDHELYNINNRLSYLNQELEQIQSEKRDSSSKMLDGLARGMAVSTLKAYGAYGDRLFQMTKRQIKSIEGVSQKAEGLREDYIMLKRELDMLEKLKGQQLEEYLHNLAQKQDQEIESIISYKMVRGAENDDSQ